MSVIDWLLDSDPSIRWQVMQDLTSETDSIVARERSRVASEGWGARLGCTSATTTPTPPTTSPGAQPPAPAPRFTVSGIIHETAPTQHTPIASTQVSVRSGPHDATATTTDASGRFRFEGIESAGFSIVMSKPDYDFTTYDITSLTADVQLDLGMAPSLVTKTYQFQGNDGCLLPTLGSFGGRVVGEIAVHHDGHSSFDSRDNCPCFSSDNALYIFGRTENGQVFQVPKTWSWMDGRGSAMLKAGHTYLLFRAGDGYPCVPGGLGNFYNWKWSRQTENPPPARTIDS